jgi:PAS domain S-box-containing protein
MTPITVRLLLIDDTPANLPRVQHALTVPNFATHFKVTRIDSTITAAQGLLGTSADAVLLSLPSPRLQDYIHVTAGRLPLVVLVETEAEGDQAVTAGAIDYLLMAQQAGATMARLLTMIIENFYMQRQLAYYETELNISEDRFRNIVLPSVDGTIIVDENRVILFANASAERILGLSLETLIGSIAELPLLPDRVTEITLTATDEVKTVVELRVIDTMWESAPARLVTLRDITTQNRADNALSKVVMANNQWLTALNTLHTGVFITDPNLPDNPMIYVNPACLNMTGYTRDELLGQNIRMLQGPQTDITSVQRIRQAMIDKDQFHGIVLNYRKSGEVFWNELTINPVFDEQDRLINFIGLQSDVTDRVQSMEQLHHRRRIEGLVTTVSSEFVNLSDDQYDEAINRSLAKIGRFIGADRCSIIQLDAPDGLLHLTHHWAGDGIAPLETANETMDYFVRYPWWYDQLSRLETVHIPTLSSIPPAGILERQAMEDDGIKSALMVPMQREDTFAGYIVFSTLRQERSWADGDIALLRVLGEMIFSVLQRKRTKEALRASEERFRTVIANTPMIMFTYDTQGIVTFMSGKGLENTGSRSDQLVGKSIYDFYRREPTLINYCKRALTGDSFLGVVNSQALPGLTFETWFSPLRASDGTVIGGSGVAMDVSDRYRAQVAEREQRALAEALRDTASALTRSLDPDEVMNEILDNANRVVPHVSASIVLLMPDGASVDYVRGRTSELLSSRTTYMLPIDLYTIQYMRETGKPCLIPDVTRFTGWRIMPGMEWIRSYLGVPIMAFGEVVGFLNLDHDTPNFFTPIHAERLKAFADQAAIAIQNAQLFDQIRRDAQQMAVLNQATSFLHTSLVDSGDLESLCYQVAEVVVREFGKVDCSIILRDKDGNPGRVARAGQYQAASDADLSVDIAIYETLREERVLYVHDVLVNPAYADGDKRTRSRLVMPLRTPRGVMGILDLRSMYPDAFGEADRNTLQAFAERAATAIENARLYSEVLTNKSDLEKRVRERTHDLASERERLSAILNSMDEAVVTWQLRDDLVTFQYANGAFHQIFHYTDQDFDGVPNFYKFLLVEENDQRRFAKIIVEGLNRTSHLSMEAQLRRADGSTFDALLTATRLKDTDGLTGVLLIRDISQQKALQQQKDRFIANASHELRTPLANLKLRTYLLNKQPERTDEHLKVVQQVVDRMHNLMEDLLDVTRFEQGKITLNRADMNLSNLIRQVVEMEDVQAKNKGIHLGAALPTDELHAYIDESRLRQVITNLTINAINYTPSGGEVTLKLERDPDNVHQVLVHVQDTGIGIAPDMLEQIFNPFVRANDGTTRGTGLGLTISKEIVSLHGGSISVTSQVNVGTTFTVALPLTVTEQQP